MGIISRHVNGWNPQTFTRTPTVAHLITFQQGGLGSKMSVPLGKYPKILPPCTYSTYLGYIGPLVINT